MGGEYLTVRRHPSNSIPSVRIASEAVAYVLLRPHLAKSIASPLQLRLPSASPPPVSLYDREARVYRTYGAPRTYMTPLHGAECDGFGNVSQVDLTGLDEPACGLRWLVVSIVNYPRFFQGQESTHYPLLITHPPPSTSWLFDTHWSLPTAHYPLLPTAHCSLLTCGPRIAQESSGKSKV